MQRYILYTFLQTNFMFLFTINFYGCNQAFTFSLEVPFVSISIPTIKELFQHSKSYNSNLDLLME